MQIEADSHPLLDVRAFQTTFPAALGESATPGTVLDLLQPGAESAAPIHSSDEVRRAVRDLLRHGGFKPTGRNKPASEYLIKAVDQSLLTSINTAVDVCNVVSFHSGLPISVVDADKLTAPLSICVAGPETEYVFNLSGQVLRLDGLLCLADANGYCANAVKDCQRTKTDGQTRRTVSVIWGTSALPGRSETTLAWYWELLTTCGADVTDIPAT